MSLVIIGTIFFVIVVAVLYFLTSKNKNTTINRTLRNDSGLRDLNPSPQTSSPQNLQQNPSSHTSQTQSP
jgi:hypothetical protein